MFNFGKFHYFTSDEKISCICDKRNKSNKSTFHNVTDIQNHKKGVLCDVKLPDDFVYPIKFFETSEIMSIIVDSQDNFYFRGVSILETEDYYLSFHKISEDEYPDTYKFISGNDLECVRLLNKGIDNEFNQTIYLLASGKIKFIYWGDFGSNRNPKYEKIEEEVKLDVCVEEIYRTSPKEGSYLMFRSSEDLYLLENGSSIPAKVKGCNSPIKSVKLFNCNFFILDSLGSLYVSMDFEPDEEGFCYVRKINMGNTKLAAFDAIEYREQLTEFSDKLFVYKLVLTDDMGNVFGAELVHSDVFGEKLEILLHYLEGMSSVTIISVSKKSVIFLDGDGCVYRRRISCYSPFRRQRLCQENVKIMDMFEKGFSFSFPRRNIF